MIHDDQEGDGDRCFLRGKEFDGIQSHQKLHHVDKSSACPQCVSLFVPLDHRTNDDQAKMKFQQVGWISLLYPDIHVFPTWKDYSQDYPRC